MGKKTNIRIIGEVLTFVSNILKKLQNNTIIRSIIYIVKTK